MASPNPLAEGDPGTSELKLLYLKFKRQISFEVVYKIKAIP